MEPIIDVEYREIEELDKLSTKELTAEANALWKQAEAAVGITVMMMAETGKRLIVIKDRLEHGEWEEWCKKNLDFSVRKAYNAMKLADKVDCKNSVFSNLQTFADIGISKVWELLAAPEDVAEKVLENPEISEMTVRELKDEIKRCKAENEEKSADFFRMEAELAAAKVKAEEAEKRVAELQQQAEAAPPANAEEVTRLEEELAKAKAKLEKEKEKVKAAKAAADTERVDAVTAARKQAMEEAKKQFDEESRFLRTSNQEAAAEIDRLQRQVKNSQNTDLVEFKLKSQQLQIDFNACLSSIAAVAQTDESQAGKMRAALKTVMEKLMGEI